MNYKMNFKEM